MKKKIILILIILISIIGCLFLYKNYQEYIASDNYRFLSEYNIKLDNVTYLNLNEALEVFDKQKAILFIGSKKNLDCQKIMDIFNNVMAKYEIINFYYLDIEDELPNFEIVDNKVVKNKDGSEDYYKLLAKLDPFLNEKIIKKGNQEYKTEEKEIKIPLIITIKDQNILNYYYLKEEFNENDVEQRLKLTDIYSDMIVELLN